MHRPRTADTAKAQALAQAAAEAAASRRARNVTILDLRGLAAFTDFFVLCTATSDTHAEGIANIIQERIEEQGIRPWHREGGRGAQWVLLDYVDFVVHVFLTDARQLYALERLWADAPATVLEDDEAQVEPDWEEVENGGVSITRYTAMDDVDDEREEAHEYDEEE